jgi:hypothetical protein
MSRKELQNAIQYTVPTPPEFSTIQLPHLLYVDDTSKQNDAFITS